MLAGGGRNSPSGFPWTATVETSRRPSTSCRCLSGHAGFSSPVNRASSRRPAHQLCARTRRKCHQTAGINVLRAYTGGLLQHGAHASGPPFRLASLIQSTCLRAIATLWRHFRRARTRRVVKVRQGAAGGVHSPGMAADRAMGQPPPPKVNHRRWDGSTSRSTAQPCGHLSPTGPRPSAPGNRSGRPLCRNTAGPRDGGPQGPHPGGWAGRTRC